MWTLCLLSLSPPKASIVATRTLVCIGMGTVGSDWMCTKISMLTNTGYLMFFLPKGHLWHVKEDSSPLQWGRP